MRRPHLPDFRHDDYGERGRPMRPHQPRRDAASVCDFRGARVVFDIHRRGIRANPRNRGERRDFVGLRRRAPHFHARLHEEKGGKKEVTHKLRAEFPSWRNIPARFSRADFRNDARIFFG